MIRLGILGCSEIAFRRFMPAVQNVEGIEVIAVAEEYAPAKLDAFCEAYPMDRETSFETLIKREDIDAVYVPQPPAMHYKWAKMALECGKHVLIEKPSTTSYRDSSDLVEIARERRLALHENYMFQYHSQIRAIKELVAAGKIGDVRLLRADFGFPLRQKNDFRYSKALGGGALLDAAGYTVKLATLFLGSTIHVDTAAMTGLPGYEVDMLGNATLSNDRGLVCQIGYGMDCGYRCSLEIWGSKGRILTNRIFTAPPDYRPTAQIETASGTETVEFEADAHFEHSIREFVREVQDPEKRNAMYDSILLQSKLIDEIREKNINAEKDSWDAIASEITGVANNLVKVADGVSMILKRLEEKVKEQ
ncbi:MAG: Gfo/Idh/MocA family oxidoreductase [Mogibacterium sp.]|nr:Gfo/Idh/MocA family oxidoreductase [Mogibacterium sp.]